MPSYTGTVNADATLVAAPATGQIRVLGYQVSSAGNPGKTTLDSNSTPMATIDNFTASGGTFVCPPFRDGYFDCAAGEALKINVTTAAVNVSVNVQYVIIGN